MKKRYLTIFVSTLFICISTQVLSNPDSNSTDEVASSLREIMRGMDKDMQLISNAISREDWNLVEELSPEIANHKQPKFND